MQQLGACFTWANASSDTHKQASAAVSGRAHFLRAAAHSVALTDTHAHAPFLADTFSGDPAPSLRSYLPQNIVRISHPPSLTFCKALHRRIATLARDPAAQSGPTCRITTQSASNKTRTSTTSNTSASAPIDPTVLRFHLSFLLSRQPFGLPAQPGTFSNAFMASWCA